jgi:hypothetical protein
MQNESGFAFASIAICFAGIFWLFPSLATYWESTKDFVSRNLEKFILIKKKAELLKIEKKNIEEAYRALKSLNSAYKCKWRPFFILLFPFLLFCIGIIFGLLYLLNFFIPLCAFQVILFLCFFATVCPFIILLYDRMKTRLTSKIANAELTEIEEILLICNETESK